MTSTGDGGGPRLHATLLRTVSFAIEPGDEDDAQLRKRVGVVAGYLSAVAPLALPIQAGFHPASLVLATVLPLFAMGNLIVLARTRDFDRYVVALILAGLVFVPAATWVGGGLTGSTAGLPWGFLVPAYAIMALGPAKATPWFVAYVASVALMALVDPFVRDAVGVGPYGAVLLSQVVNTVAPLSITFLLLRYIDVRRRIAEARADELLTNAIPRPIATRLKRGEARIADSYPATTVLFADIVGFTPWAQRTPPDEVVALLDGLFTRFDELTAVHGLEKIKTIGDAYMAVAGAPQPRSDHASATVGLARAMIAAVGDLRVATGIDLHMRVGIASGPVVAGVIGRQRLLFDLWGDTVNLAARMESSGVPDRIQVASATRDLLGDEVGSEPRDLDVKGLGRMTAFLIS